MFGVPRAVGRHLAAGLALALLMAAPAAADQAQDARKQLLQDMGIKWGRDAFNRALFIDKNYAAVELFFKGGWKINYDEHYGGPAFPAILWNLSKGGRIEGDTKIAELLLKYKAVDDPAKQCPTAAVPGSPGDDFELYTVGAASNPVATMVARAVCANPAVLAKIDANLAKTKKAHDRTQFAGWTAARALLTASP